MDIFFPDLSAVPVPPDEVRILDLKIEPWSDGRRIRVYVELTPFQKKPHGDIVIQDAVGNPVASTSFIEAITPWIEMTLHLRSLDPTGQYKAIVTLFYLEEIEDETQGDKVWVRPSKIIVDEATQQFEMMKPG